MMNTLVKRLILSGLVMLLSACASSRYDNFGGYSGDDGYYQGYGYPNSGYYPPPNNPYGYGYRRYPANPGSGRYNQPYYGGYPNNNYYYRNQTRPIPAPPGFYRRNPPPQVHHHHHENNYYYGRPPNNQGGWQAGRRPPSAPPAVGRWQGQPPPQRDFGNQPPNWGGQRNWQRPQNNNFNRPGGGGGSWRAQNRAQQPVVRIENNGGNVNFGRITDRMGQQPMQPGRDRAWERKRRNRDD